MLGIVVTGGDGPPVEKVAAYFENTGLVVAADSGLLLCRRYGICPSIIAGDMDSLPDLSLLDLYPDTEIRKFDRDKDDTDTEIGLKILSEKHCERKIIIGGGGGRLDHLLGIVSLFHRTLAPDAWLSGNAEVVLIKDSYEIDCIPGEELSFFPTGRGESTMKSTGLKWPLDSLSWTIGDVGISNRAVDSKVTVAMKSGAVILVRRY
jgi:thiamine pyrophosphokinase